ncbi:MAG: phenylacetate-CoA oxygenase subunit PaaJ [Bacteroidota bacterium]|jgi:ring-1,2-phenylacetyl-CoA epoxidase subunit PaaD
MLTTANIYEALQQVSDPEIPALSVIDLGMIVDVSLFENSAIVKMIPTYAACPATSFIKNHIQSHLKNIFIHEKIEVVVDTSIHWNTNMITDEGKQKLKNFGIAAPRKHFGTVDAELLSGAICPHCESDNTILRTPFGSTLCRAIQFCKNCQQTFEQFKPFAAE